MNKKTLFAIFMLFACAFVFMTGKSDWLIIEDYETEINTSYYPVSITGEKETTYNGDYLPFTENDVEIDNSSDVEFDSKLLEFVYYESIEDDNIKKMDHAPVNVGQYFVDVKYDSELISTISYVVNPCDVYIKLNDNTITYGDAPTANGYSLYSDNAVENAFAFPTNVLTNTQDTIGDLVYSYSYKQYGTVGDYNISIDFNSSKLNSNYTFYQIDKSKLTVNKKDINFTWEDNYSWEYDGKPHHPSVTLDPNGIVNNDQIVLKYNGVQTNASDTAYTVELLNNLTNYNIIEDENNKFTKDYYITRREVTASWDNNTEFTYDNTNKKQAPAITLGNLVDGEDLTPVYEYYELIDGSYNKISSMPYEVGSYKVVLVGLSDGANGLASNYKLPEETIEKEFEIIPLEVTINWENNEVTYNGENQYITVIPGDYKANDYKIVYDNDETLEPFDAKTYSVKFVTTNKNYTILNNSDVTSFIINPKQIDLTWSGDKEVDLGIGMEYKGANTPVGPAPNLVESQICEYDITNNTLEVYIIDSTMNALANANYEGTEAFASKYTAEALLNNSNYVINNNKTCDYYVLRALMDSYFTNVNARTTIIPNFEFIYNAEAQIPTAYINESMLKGNDAVFTPIVTPTLDGNETESINVGNYLATITGLNNNNYELTANNTATYTISPKVIGAEWTNIIVDYNGLAQAPTLTITGLCGSDLVNGTISYSLDGNIVDEAKNAGIYTVTVASLDNSNYRLPIEGENSYESITSTFTINKLKLTITANDHTITYGDSAANNGVSYAGFLAGENESVLTGELVYSYDGYIIGSPVGTYNITVTGLEGINYEITYKPGTLTVEQLELQISWGNTTLEYNGNAQAPSPVFTNTLSGDDVEAQVTGQEREVGNGYTATISNISGSDSLNYKLPSDVSTTYNIIPKTIYLTKWDTISYVFDGDNHTAAATLSGVIAGEDCYVTTTSYRNVGEYTVTAELSGTNSGNYVLDKEYTVTLEITPMDIAITWSNLEFTYDGKTHKPTATLPTLIGNDQVTITVTGEQINAGDNYTAGIELAGENANNYNVTNATAPFVIKKAPLTVTANNHTITYGDSAANNGVTYSGFVNGETEAALDTTNISYTYGNYSVGSNVGSYQITPSGIIAANYQITYVDGTLTVIAKNVTAEWNEAAEYIYSGLNQGPTAKVIGINNTELNVTITYDSLDAGERTASLSLSGDDALNYYITNSTCDYIIKKKALTIKANDYELIYGDEVPQFEVSYEGFVNGETESVLTGTLLFDTDYVQYANIGNYDINISGLSSNNYEITYTPGNIKVNEYSLTITWGVTSFVYNGNVQGPSATAVGLNNDQLTVNVTYDGVTVGEYTASATLVGEKASNYVISNPTTTYEITKAIYDMSNVSFADNTVTYNGEAHNIVITGELPAGVTVEYEYKLNDTIIPSNEVINAGTYNVTAKFTGDSVNYELINDMIATLIINKKEYDVSSLTWNYTEPFTYDKTEKSVELSSIPTGLTPIYENDSATNAGNYTATVTFTYNENNYIVTGTVTELEWTINKAVVTAPTADSTVFTYNGTEYTYTLEASDLYTISGNKQTNAGTYTVTVTLVDSNNYKWSDNKTNPLYYTFIINKAKLDKPLADNTVFTYNGLDQTYTLVENDNYTISNNVQKNANIYTVLVEINDKANYEWSDGTTADLTFEFIINQATIDLSKAEWNYTDPFTYDKEEHEVVLSTIPSNITITSYSNNKATNAGNYTATVEEFTYDTVNYKLSGEIPSCSWVINKATIEAPVEDTTVYTYTGKSQTYNIPENENYKVENNVQTEADTYTVIVSLIDSDNYEWSDGTTDDLTFEFIINQANHEMTDISFINTTQTYTGSALAITAENVPSGLNVSYKYYQNDTVIPAENVINVGTYKVIVSFTDTTGNYNNPADMEISLIIEKAQAVINVDPTLIEVTYGDTWSIPTASTNFGIATCDKTLEDMVNAGDYTIKYTVEDTNNYFGATATVIVKVNRKIVDTLPTVVGTYTYTGVVQTVELSGLESYMTIETGNTGTNADDYTVVIKLDNNHTWAEGLDGKITWKIEKATYDMSKVKLNDLTVTYDGNEHKLEITGDLPDGVSVSYSYNTLTNVGYIIVTASFTGDAGNYNPINSMTAVLTINSASIEGITFTGDTITYDENVHSIYIEGTLPNGVTVSYENNNQTNVGKYTVIAKFADSTGNYTVPQDMQATLEITKAQAVITVNPTEIIVKYGDNIEIPEASSNFGDVKVETEDMINVGNYEITYSVEGTDNYDGATAIVMVVINPKEVSEPTLADIGVYTYTGSPITVNLNGYDESYMNISNNTATNAATYEAEITLNNNYTWAEGSDGIITWIIEKAQAVITVDQTPIVVTYGDTWSIPTASTDFGVVKCDKTLVDMKNAGNYTITYTVEDTNNYFGATATVIVKVNRKIVDTLPTVVGTYTYTGVEQTVELSGVESYMTVTNNTKTNAGTHTVTVTLDNNHMWASGLDGNVLWTIEKASLVVKVNNHTTTYGSIIPTYSVTYSNFVGNDSINSNDLTGNLSFECSYVQGSNVGTYSITASGLHSNNYSISYEKGTLTVNQRTVTIIWSDETEFEYDGESKMPEYSLANVYGSDVVDIIIFIYQNDNIVSAAVDTGEYTAKAMSLLNSNNYILSNNYRTCEFTIVGSKLGTIITNAPTVDIMVEGEVKELKNGVATTTDGTVVSGTFILADYNDTSELEYTGVSGTSTQTVTVRFIPDDTDSYRESTCEITITMKAVAYIGAIHYGTIEKALSSASSGQIVYVIPGTNPTIRNNTTVKSGVSLIIPYEGTTYANRQGTVNSNKMADATASNLKNTVTIANGVTITIEASGSLMIGGILGKTGQGLSGQTSMSYTQIVMDNNSQIISNGTIDCYGFIKETESNNNSKVVLQSGNLYMPFVIYDYRGGSITAGNYNEGGICPFNIYDMPNIHSIVECSSSASIIGYVDLYTGAVSISQLGITASIAERHNTDEIKVISNSNALINLNSGAKAIIDYAPVLDSNGNMTTNSTSTTGLTTLELHGGASFGAVSIKVEAAKDVTYSSPIAGLLQGIIENLLNVSISTSTVQFPVSHTYNIELYNGTFNIDNRMKFMTGSSLYVDSSATLNINAETIFYSQFTDTYTNTSSRYPEKDSAVLMVNGKLNINAAFGGYIQTSEVDAFMTVNSATLSVSSVEGTGGRDGISLTFTPIANITENAIATVNDVTNTLLGSGAYISDGNSWNIAEGYTNYTFTYNANGGTLTGNASDSFPIKENTSTTIENVATSTPTRKHYEFNGWYLDANCTTSIVGHTVLADSNTTLYAGWTEVEYTINYMIIYEDCEGTSSPNNNATSYKYYSTQSITLNMLSGTSNEGLNLTFYGWYVNTDMTDPINIFNQSVYDTYFDGETTITLYGVFSDKQLITIEFDSNGKDLSYNSISIMEGNRVASKDIPNPSSFNLDPTSNVKFDGWYLSDRTTKFDANYVVDYNDSDNGKIIVYARWTEKDRSITYKQGTDLNETILGANYTKPADITYYYDSGDSTNILLEASPEPGHTFSGWLCNIDGKIYAPSEINTSVFNQNVVLTATYTIETYTISILGSANQSVTVTVNGTTIASGTSLNYSGTVAYGSTINISYSKGSGLLFNRKYTSCTVSYSHPAQGTTTLNLANGYSSGVNETFNVGKGNVSIVFNKTS